MVVAVVGLRDADARFGSLQRHNDSKSEVRLGTGTPRDALAPYPWSGSVNWRRAQG